MGAGSIIFWERRDGFVPIKELDKVSWEPGTAVINMHSKGTIVDRTTAMLWDYLAIFTTVSSNSVPASLPPIETCQETSATQYR